MTTIADKRMELQEIARNRKMLPADKEKAIVKIIDETYDRDLKSLIDMGTDATLRKLDISEVTRRLDNIKNIIASAPPTFTSDRQRLKEQIGPTTGTGRKSRKGRKNKKTRKTRGRRRV